MDDFKRNPNISLKNSTIETIDKYRVGQRYKNRSEYIQDIVDKDLNYTYLDYISELLSMNVIPLMGFFIFLVCSIIEPNFFFYLCMLVFGILGIWLSILYAKRHSRQNKNKEN